MRFSRFSLRSPRTLLLAATAGSALCVLCVTGTWAAARKPPRNASTVALTPPSAKVFKAYQEDWARALREYRKGDHRDAVERLDELAVADALGELYRQVVLAQTHGRARDTSRADAALAAALASPAASDIVWQRYLHKMRLATSSSLAPSARREYLLSALRAPLDNNDKAEALYRLLALDTTVTTRPERAGWRRQLVGVALPGARLESEYRAWVAEAAATPDTSPETQRLLLDVEEKLGRWDAAIARANTLVARDTATARARPLRLRIAGWYTAKGAHESAIKEYLALRESGGDTPDILLQLARAYRARGQDGPSQSWYTRLATRFPRDARTAEVLWMRAFEDEMAGKHDTALSAYTRIARDFPRHARGGEAMFRRGLVLFRRGDHEAARSAFAALRVAPGVSGRLIGAAHYWEGRALAAQGREPEARQAWAEMSRDFPFGHYGHLARQELEKRGALPDTLAWPVMLNKASGDAVREWFRIVLRAPVPAIPAATGEGASPDTAKAAASAPRLAAADGYADGFGESSWMPVERLFAHGLDTLAVLTLQARANAAPGNLWLVYDAAVRCRSAGFGYEAYRFALRLSDKLPLAQWPAAPVEVLRLFYPPSYIELVRPEAQRAGIPAGLALALIKQESGFDPGAVSRVGARGLMQLMPATGAEQARKEGFRNFHPDSLFTPAVNIKLGVAYLRDVLARHDGNVAYALAHYNAGPTALARWIPRLQNRPPEDAVEDIGYAETREYVKRVGANYKTYQVLWDGVRQ